jgi:hypothetical protein
MTERSNHPEGVLSLQNIAMPADTNWSGDVFGGWIVSQMDEAKRNHTIDSVAAAWMNSPKAIAKMMNERAIVFL